MKTMTEFIMEQEAPQVVEESFNDADLVSRFMALQAASANLSCVMEFATIAEFCNENEINMPESLVQEGFRDVMDKVFDAIGNFFQKIADWFKSLIKGASSAFAKSKVNELIAKLKHAKFADDKLPAEIGKNLKYINATYQIVWNFFVTFKEVLTKYEDALADKQPDPTKSSYGALMTYIDDYTSDLEVFKKEGQWYNPGDGSVNFEKFSNITAKAGIKSTDNLSDEIEIKDAVAILENINKYNIPTKANDLYNKIVTEEKKFADVIKGTAPDPSDPTKTAETVSYSKEQKALTDAKNKIQKCSNALANAYDKVTSKLIELYGKNLKGVEAPANDKDSKKAYNDTVEAKKKQTGSGDLTEAKKI